MNMLLPGLARILSVGLAVAIVPAAADGARPARAPAPGKEFRDCAECPIMVAMPRGSFVMGSPASEPGRSENEGPQQKISFSAPLAIAKRETTFAEWDACVAGGGCRPGVEDEGWGRGEMPAINVTWVDAEAYAAWLSKKTGKAYRLPSEAEWEYGARGGASTQYSWGGQASRDHANYGQEECCGGHAEGRDKWVMTAPVASFPANPFGLHDMLGNVWEWAGDCWVDTHAGAPADGSARGAGPGADCNRHATRGGSWSSLPVRIRAAYREGYPPYDMGRFIGFRVARAGD